VGLLAECPVCHRPLQWTYLLRPLWSRWRCPSCDSLLTINKKRRLLAVLALLVLELPVIWFFVDIGWGPWAGGVALLALWVPYFVALDRAAVVERCGFRCKQCGYDLQGQVVPRCPECGGPLDVEQRAILAGSQPVPRPRRRVGRARLTITLIVCSFLALLIAVGYTHYRGASARIAQKRAVASQPGSPAAATQPEPNAIAP
jgi:hypothetical protein